MAPLLFFVNFYLVASTCLLSNVVRAELRSVTVRPVLPRRTLNHMTNIDALSPDKLYHPG
ncbi:hypothetical protein CPC08DRAFT_105882 [Agrocybe pediades]|nr:hypothetical protein CPC08DRAFT_105882 [Agrocybe pediades]